MRRVADAVPKTRKQIETTMKITLDANPSDAPCCLKIKAEDGRDILVQTDFDWPSVASSFGWSIRYAGGLACRHDGTDGTVPCPQCDTPVSFFIQCAREWLDENDGAQAEDPGYFND